MAAPALSAFCIGCTKYAAGDTLGKLLAVVCAAPYFAVYHCAVAAHARRELHLLFLFVGMLANAGASMAIKRLVRRPRPNSACSLLGKCTGHGWPSSHTQVMAFALAACTLLYLHRRRAGNAARHSALATVAQLLELVLLAAAMMGVAAGRVYLGYHSVDQVAAGVVFGALLAGLWFAATLRLLRSRLASLLLRLLGPLGFHDSLASEERQGTHAGKSD